jgi:transposase
VRVPDVAEEAVRDRHRVAKFLLRHGRIWRDGQNWTMKHEAWISAQRFDEPALDAALSHYQATLTARVAAVDAIDTELRLWFEREPFADAVRRLSAYRGVTELGALTLATEVCDWRRFPTAGSFSAFCGLVPSEHSSGERTWRGGISHAGNTHLRTQLVESAWSYRTRAQVGPVLRRRHEGLDPQVVARAWAAQLRLCGRFSRLDARKSSRKTVVTAIARELACFMWAEMTAAASPLASPRRTVEPLPALPRHHNGEPRSSRDPRIPPPAHRQPAPRLLDPARPKDKIRKSVPDP